MTPFVSKSEKSAFLEASKEFFLLSPVQHAKFLKMIQFQRTYKKFPLT